MTYLFERNFDKEGSDRDLYIPGSIDYLDSNSFIESDTKAFERKPPITVHLIEQDVSLRAQLARRLTQAGFHTEIYSGSLEFAEYAPKCGVILIDDANHPLGLPGMNGELGASGAALAIIVYCARPTVSGAVAAMRSRAVNYVSLDVSDLVLEDLIRDGFRESETRRSRLTQVSNCGKLIASLSHRERQVLDSLAEGESNKGIARLLDISPRTVEIHRMKMLGKLGVKSPAQAVRIWCNARLYS
ncbi:response regulator transcription factor [Novosphingobium sp.]|uniref:response regulator transcription factor n=1 Tax=Novosphingobium sp. TaxID=1874826 RepID=UPI003D0C51AB